MSEDQAPFNVHEEIIVGDLSEVKETKQIVPASQNVKVRIEKASLQANKSADIKSLKLQVRIVDGIPIPNQETGEVEMKYINKPMFTGLMDLIVWVDPETRNLPWFQNRSHLVEFSKLLRALGSDIKDVRVNDAFYSAIIGAEFLIDIKHEEDTIVDPETGERKKTGTYRERLRNWRKA